MSAIKIIGLVLLSIILFLSLNIFGMAFMIDRTILNANFISDEFNRLDITSIVRDAITESSDMTPEMADAIDKTVAAMEPHVEAALRSGLNDIYDYLKGKRAEPQLALVLRNSFFSPDLLAAVIDELDFTPTIMQIVEEQLEQNAPVPDEMAPHMPALLTDFLASHEPWLKNEIKNAAGQLADYFLGIAPDFNISISISQLLIDLEEPLYELFLEYPPAELQGFPPAMFEAEFNKLYAEVTSEIPPTIQVDSSFIGTDAPQQITTMLSEAETTLAEVKTWVNYFQTVFYIVLAVVLVLIGLIILICRAVRCSTRTLGIVFLLYGLITLIGVLVGQTTVTNQVMGAVSDVPAVIENWAPQFITDLLKPLRWLSIGCLAGGAVLIVVSFIYRRQRTDEIEPYDTTPA